MLLGVDRGDSLVERIRGQRPAAILLGLALALEVFFAVRAGVGLSRHAPGGFDQVNAGGNARALAEVLFRRYFFPFEATSILLIVAAIAAMVLASRRSRAITQAEAAAAEPEPEPVP
jgi:NADH-quinone oxidoreductase subunit J